MNNLRSLIVEGIGSVYPPQSLGELEEKVLLLCKQSYEYGLTQMYITAINQFDRAIDELRENHE